MNKEYIDIKLTPTLISNGTLDFADYYLSMNGLLSDTVPWITIDKKFKVVQQHPGSIIYICPIVPNKQPTKEEIWAINDYFSYMNEVPSVPISENKSFKEYGYEYLYGRVKKSQISTEYTIESEEVKTCIQKPEKKYEVEDFYYNNTQLTILSNISELRFGPFSGVSFYIRNKKIKNIYMEYEFKPIKKEVEIYAMALRQFDYLAEILCYYRIFESIALDKHKKLLEETIPKIKNFNFGRLYIFNDNESRDVRPPNIYTILKRRAIKHLDYLCSEMSISEVASYLYKHERCEIVHAKNTSRTSKVSKEYFNSYRNMIILKLASRIVIQEKLDKYHLKGGFRFIKSIRDNLSY